VATAGLLRESTAEPAVSMRCGIYIQKTGTVNVRVKNFPKDSYEGLVFFMGVMSISQWVLETRFVYEGLDLGFVI